MKDKKRYVLIKVQSLVNLDSEEIKKAIYQASLTLWGEGGLSKANLRFLEYDAKTNLALICVNTGELENTLCALALKVKYNEQPIALRTIKLSGTIKSLGFSHKKTS